MPGSVLDAPGLNTSEIQSLSGEACMCLRIAVDHGKGSDPQPCQVQSSLFYMKNIL